MSSISNSIEAPFDKWKMLKKELKKYYQKDVKINIEFKSESNSELNFGVFEETVKFIFNNEKYCLLKLFMK